jgi:D-amino-acid dehydrogenase
VTSASQRIAVIGAGIAGITTAFELAEDGHHVTLYERCDSVAAEGSFANAGLVSPGSVSPAAARGLHRWLLRGLFSHDAALHWRPRFSPAQWRWLRAWWQACGQGHEHDVRAMVALARHSQARLQDLTHRLALDYERSDGVLLLLRHSREFRPSLRHVQMLNELGVPAEPLDPDACRAIEPGLGEQSPAGGVHLSGDGVANCRQFAQQLRDRLALQGDVQLHWSTAVTRIGREGGRIQIEHAPNGVQGPAQPPRLAEHDAVVVCAGASAPLLLRPLGWRLPLMPVLGHSVTFRLQAHGRAPRSAVVDASAGVAIARQGGRIRITGGYSLGGRGTPGDPGEAALKPLYRALNRWFPYAAERAQAQVWTGARPMLPAGPPIVGEAPRGAGDGRVWLNLGHGAHGWTLACGSARLLADQIAGRAPALDPAPFAATRWLKT